MSYKIILLSWWCFFFQGDNLIQYYKDSYSYWFYYLHDLHILLTNITHTDCFSSRPDSAVVCPFPLSGSKCHRKVPDKYQSGGGLGQSNGMLWQHLLGLRKDSCRDICTHSWWMCLFFAAWRTANWPERRHGQKNSGPFPSQVFGFFISMYLAMSGNLSQIYTSNVSLMLTKRSLTFLKHSLTLLKHSLTV